MTNHPRRTGRRKHQRQIARGWTDLTPYVTGVRLGEGKTWAPSHVAAAPTDRQHLTHVHRWPNGRIDVFPPRQQQLKEPA